MADNHNHSHITVINETINKPLQIQGDSKSKYFTKDKFMNNYEEIFSEDEIRQTPYNIMGRFNREQYKVNVEKYSLSNWKQEISNPEKHLWDLPYKGDDYEEDNDTDEEDDEDEEHFDEGIMKDSKKVKNLG